MTEGRRKDHDLGRDLLAGVALPRATPRPQRMWQRGEERSKVKHENARGLSGSLVWNTRYLEVMKAGGQWTPTDAVVSGMAQRWDDEAETLLIYRVEHIRTSIST